MNPKLIKPAVYMFLGLFVLIILAVALKKLFMPNDGDQASDDARKSIDRDQLTYSEAVYSAWAERLFRAMNGMGTDENTIFDILANLETKSDWYKLVAVFGDKPYDGSKLSLIGWFQEELDTNEMSTVRNLLKNISVTI